MNELDPRKTWQYQLLLEQGKTDSEAVDRVREHERKLRIDNAIHNAVFDKEYAALVESRKGPKSNLFGVNN